MKAIISSVYTENVWLSQCDRDKVDMIKLWNDPHVFFFYKKVFGGKWSNHYSHLSSELIMFLSLSKTVKDSWGITYGYTKLLGYSESQNEIVLLVLKN